MLKKIKHYFSEELWNFPLNREKGFSKFFYKWLRIPCLAIKGFFEHNCSLSISSLTYYTLLSAVPLLSVIVAFANSLGYQGYFREEVLRQFPNQATALNVIFKYADVFLSEAREGVVAALGSGLLLLTAVFLLIDLESIFNQIWGEQRLRSWLRVVVRYIALVFIVPALFLTANSLLIFIGKYFRDFFIRLPISDALTSVVLFFVNLVPYGLFWILFTFIFLVIPNTKVKFRSACAGGFFTGLAYVIVQWFYVKFQIGVAQYGAIYGSMAALPLFLIWVQMSWLFFLMGAEICYAHQTLYEHEYGGKAARCSYSFQQVTTLWIVHIALKKGCVTSSQLCHEQHIPFALSQPILAKLTENQILHPTKEGYIPVPGIERMKISDVIECLETKGESDFPSIDPLQIAPFKRAIDSFYKQMEISPHNLQMNFVSDSI